MGEKSFSNNLKDHPMRDEAVYGLVLETRDLMVQMYKGLDRTESQNSRFANTESKLWYLRHREIFEKVKMYVQQLQDNFDDLSERIQYLGVIRDLIDTLKDELDRELYKYERRICIMIFDAIHKARAIDMVEEQVESLHNAMQVLFKGQCSKKEYLFVDGELRNHGLNWIVGYINE